MKALRRRHARRGFTALEVMFSLAILSIALLAATAALSGDGALRRQSREVGLATRELTRKLEHFRGMTPAAIVGEVMGTGTSPHQAITSGIGQDEHTGVTVLQDAVLTVDVLSEEEAMTAFGLATAPDLDGDGDAKVSQPRDYTVVPVRCTITWTTGPSRSASRTVCTLFYPQTTVGS